MKTDKLYANDFISRPIIREDQSHEVYNKMTDDELIIIENQFNNKELDFYDRWALFIANQIDFEITYDIIKSQFED